MLVRQRQHIMWVQHHLNMIDNKEQKYILIFILNNDLEIENSDKTSKHKIKYC